MNVEEEEDVTMNLDCVNAFLGILVIIVTLLQLWYDWELGRALMLLHKKYERITATSFTILKNTMKVWIIVVVGSESLYIRQW